MTKYFMYISIAVLVVMTSIVEAEPTWTPIIVKQEVAVAAGGMTYAFIIALIAALLFPAQTQSKLWIKLFGTEWGTISKGRIWTFLSVLITVNLLWGFLIWMPSNP